MLASRGCDVRRQRASPLPGWSSEGTPLTINAPVASGSSHGREHRVGVCGCPNAIDGVFQGSVDETRIWNTARSAAQIHASYGENHHGDRAGRPVGHEREHRRHDGGLGWREQRIPGRIAYVGTGFTGPTKRCTCGRLRDDRSRDAGYERHGVCHGDVERRERRRGHQPLPMAEERSWTSRAPRTLP
jgi:hypothetical protein